MIEFSGKTISRYSFNKKYLVSRDNKEYSFFGNGKIVKFFNEKFSDCEINFDKDTEVIFINCSFSSKCRINGSYVRLIDCKIDNRKNKYEICFNGNRVHITNLKDSGRNKESFGNINVFANSIMLSEVEISSHFNICADMVTFLDTNLDFGNNNSICSYVLCIFNSLIRVKTVDFIDLYFKDSKLYNISYVVLNGKSYLHEYDIDRINNSDRYELIFMIDGLLKKIYVSAFEKNRLELQSIDLEYKNRAKIAREEYALKLKSIEDEMRRLEDERVKATRDNFNALNGINLEMLKEKERVRTRSIGGKRE